MHQLSPFIYIWVPIYQGRCKIQFFEELVNVATSKTDGCARNSYQWEVNLFLSTMSFVACPYTFSVCTIPKGVTDKLEFSILPSYGAPFRAKEKEMEIL